MVAVLLGGIQLPGRIFGNENLAAAPDHRAQQILDAVVLNNTSQAWITPTDEQAASQPFRDYGSHAEAFEKALRQSSLDFVRNGRGLMAIHYAIGSNRQWPEFADLLGATYNGHAWNEEVGIKLEGPDYPITAAFQGQNLRLTEEIIQFKAPPFSR